MIFRSSEEISLSLSLDLNNKKKKIPLKNEINWCKTMRCLKIERKKEKKKIVAGSLFSFRSRSLFIPACSAKNVTERKSTHTHKTSRHYNCCCTICQGLFIHLQIMTYTYSPSDNDGINEK